MIGVLQPELESTSPPSSSVNIIEKDGKVFKRARFDGCTYEPQHDQKRLSRQFDRVYAAMAAGDWFTIEELHDRCGGTEAGISARIRDLRKPRNGGHSVDRRRRGDPTGGVFEYSLSGRAQ